MNPIIVYPLPLDNWKTFSEFAFRFTNTFRDFPPGTDYKLIVAVNGGKLIDDIACWFYNINTTFVDYDGLGCDIGSAQHIANHLMIDDAFIVAMTSRCYFHRQGWLRRFMEAREKHGPGLYGASASYEGGTPHICTRAYGLDASLFRKYPHLIDTRAKGQKFEVGEWCLTTWFRSQALPTIQVTWDGEQDFQHWRATAETAIYRRGGQSAMLVWDRHSDLYRDASPEEKIKLESMANPPV